MPYIVQEANGLYRDPEKSYADELGKWLSETEAMGYRLVGILPDQQMWDEDGKPEGKAPAMLILHKEGDA
jgi:hypothetical protein